MRVPVSGSDVEYQENYLISKYSKQDCGVTFHFNFMGNIEQR